MGRNTVSTKRYFALGRNKVSNLTYYFRPEYRLKRDTFFWAGIKVQKDTSFWTGIKCQKCHFIMGLNKVQK